MKIRSWHLIVGSIVLLVLDFLILANDNFSFGKEYGKATIIIALASALIFAAGIVWAIFEPIFKNKGAAVAAIASQPIEQSRKSRLSLTAPEMVSNRLFAVLLILSSIPLLLNIISLPTVIILIIFALFLWFGKTYHPVVNFFFLIIALGIYFVPIPPISWGFFRALKEFRINGLKFSFPMIFLLPLFIFISFSVRNVVGNILAYLKLDMDRRNIFYFISLFIVSAAILAYPLFDSIKLRDRTENVNIAVGGELPLVYTRQSLTFIDRYNMAGDFTSKFDPSTKKYIYHLLLSEPLAKSIQFTEVETDGEKINFATDSRIYCQNCKKDELDPYGLVFPAGKSIDFIIERDQIIKVIKFIEPENKEAEFVFWK
ncbi:MAG: hypothetical protein WC470_01140 [Candidatus Paceibacterota bacterium]